MLRNVAYHPKPREDTKGKSLKGVPKAHPLRVKGPKLGDLLVDPSGGAGMSTRFRAEVC